MIFKKRVLTYIACSVLGLFMAGMIWLYISKVFEYDIYTSCLFGAACILGYAFLFIFTYFIVFIFKKINIKVLSVIFEILIILSVVFGGIIIRCSYPGIISFYGIGNIDFSDTRSLIYLLISITKIVLIYFIARTGIGRVGGFIALCLSAYIPAFSSEYYLIDEQIIFETGLLAAALIFVLWYKRCSCNKMKTVPSWLLIGLFFIACGFGALFYNSLLMLMIVVLVSMIPKAWKQGCIMICAGIAVFVLSTFIRSEYDGENHFLHIYEKYDCKISEITDDFGEYSTGLYDDYKESAISVIADDYSAYYSEIAVFMLLAASFISIVTMFFCKRLSLMPFLIYYMFVSISAKRMILYITVICIAYGIQELHDIFRGYADKKEQERIEVLSGTVENPPVYSTQAYMTDEEYDEFFNSLPVPMSLIDSQCVIKVIDRSKSGVDECWQRRKFRAVVRSLKKYYESEDNV